MSDMTLYVCGTTAKGPFNMHPCTKAGDALSEAGYEYETKVVRGYRMMPWTWRTRAADRAEVEQLSGQRNVPILVLADGEVISGSGPIAHWAKSHPAG